MSPLPADLGPFVARARLAAGPAPAALELVPPFVASGAGSLDEGAAFSHQESDPAAERGTTTSADSAGLPWLSESAAALAGLTGLDGELIVAPPGLDVVAEEEELDVADQWDDELGTFALSEELPEAGVDEVAPEPMADVALPWEEISTPTHAPAMVTAPLPTTALEEVARRLERIARMLRERGPTGPMEENGADPLGALITGYVLGMSGAEKDKE